MRNKEESRVCVRLQASMAGYTVDATKGNENCKGKTSLGSKVGSWMKRKE